MHRNHQLQQTSWGTLPTPWRWVPYSPPVHVLAVLGGATATVGLATVAAVVAVTLAAAGLATVPFGTSGSRRWRMPGDKGGVSRKVSMRAAGLTCTFLAMCHHCCSTELLPATRSSEPPPATQAGSAACHAG